LQDETTIIQLTAEIVANYVANNPVAVNELPALIQTISQTLSTLGEAAPAAEPHSQKATAAQIRKSIKSDGLISFIDGRPYKTLKRHLSKHGLTVAEYKEKFGLPKDYPTTAADYSAKRSEMAKSLGLGRQAGVPAPVGKSKAKRASKPAAEAA
jgi:predicted transcriptional regulator